MSPACARQLRELRGVRLRGEVRVGEREVRLDLAQVDVALHDFGRDVHQRVVQLLLARALIAARRLDAAALLAEHVEVPERLESGRHCESACDDCAGLSVSFARSVG